MSGTSRFFVHKHNTLNPHYDLRIEIDGVLKSWIIPKSLPTVTNEKRIAIQDKDLELGTIYMNGVINDGYGVGEAEIWDSGSYELREKAGSKIIFETNGSKLYGRFVLLLPSWGRLSKKRLWVLFASQSVR